MAEPVAALFSVATATPELFVVVDTIAGVEPEAVFEVGPTVTVPMVLVNLTMALAMGVAPDSNTVAVKVEAVTPSAARLEGEAVMDTVKVSAPPVLPMAAPEGTVPVPNPTPVPTPQWEAYATSHLVRTDESNNMSARKSERNAGSPFQREPFALGRNLGAARRSQCGSLLECMFVCPLLRNIRRANSRPHGGKVVSQSSFS
ncbi:MAG: hypothetical protein A3H27_15425 [Acidobacteria bacterium RIFCSPLOWO2_02_FULL_59_13]|nr:MAG: hypothetical protein A3H27_15425 [Acidobacteria bacterium RIFCSPLOWO2_02_FULL_59_13]